MYSKYTKSIFPLLAIPAARPGVRTKRGQAPVRLLLQRTAKSSPLMGHTSSQTLQPFGTRCQPCRHSHGSHCASVVSRNRSNPTQSVSPSLCVACTVPTDTVQREAPALVICYCAT
mgnify:CR=1 FL=1